MTFVELVETPTLSLLKRGRRRPFDPSTSSGTKSAGTGLASATPPQGGSDQGRQTGLHADFRQFSCGRAGEAA